MTFLASSQAHSLSVPSDNDMLSKQGARRANREHCGHGPQLPPPCCEVNISQMGEDPGQRDSSALRGFTQHLRLWAWLARGHTVSPPENQKQTHDFDSQSRSLSL